MSPSTGRSGSEPGRRRRRGRRRAGSAGSGQPAPGQEPGTETDPTAAQQPARNHKRQPSRKVGQKPDAGTPPARRAGRSGRRGGAPGGQGGGQPGQGGQIAKRGGANNQAGKAGNGRNNRSRQRGRRLRTVDETSAGGLVVDAARACAALIGRLDRRGRLLWSLPKGHIEAGETPEQAAIREVAEETGIAGQVLAPLGKIDYWFVAEDRRVHKTVHHFLLEAVGGELSDEDVEVTEVAWVPLGELDTRLAYADERRLVRLAADLL